MNQIIAFVCDKLKINESDIKSLEKVPVGFTNEIYHLALVNGSEYKVRFVTTNPYINRKLESIIEHAFFKDDIIFYDEQGNFIKKWYVGHTLTKQDLNEEVWQKIIDITKQLQALEIKELNLTPPTYILYEHIVPNNLIPALWAYKRIINTIVLKDATVLSHNDFSGNNTIYTNDNKIILMDFEWASLNHPYWDISNLIKDLELNYEDIENVAALKQYDFKLLVQIIFAAHYFTYFWTYKVEDTPPIAKYRLEVIERIFYWYNILKDKGWAHCD